jgi:hypothetical protein
MKFNFKNLEQPISCSDFWYDLKEGYIKPEGLLENEEQIKKIKEALRILRDFEDETIAEDKIIYV